MADNKKYFLDLGGLQTLWNKMKTTFASITDMQSLNANVGTISANLDILRNDIDINEALTLSYAPKTAINYSAALKIASEATAAGTIIIVGEDETIGDVTYSEGFYIVHTDASLQYIGTSTGISGQDDIIALRNKIAEIESKIITAVNIVDSNGNSLGSHTILKNNLLVIHDDEVVANSDSINALTHRAIAAKFNKIENLLTSIPKFKIEVVNELPTTEISFYTIYLVKNSTSNTDDIYTEYIYIQDTNNGNHWEKLGSQSIALDNYVTKDYLIKTVNAALLNYAKTTDVETAIALVKAEIANTYAKKEEVLTEDDIILSIVSGNIGDAIKISNQQIEQLT